MGTKAVESVRCRDGLRGVLEPSGSDGASRVIRLDDGRRLVVAASLLKADAEGGYELPLGRAEIGQLAGAARETDVVIPLTEETAEVATRRVETGRVRVSKTVSERSEVIDLPLNRETVEVERVAVNRIVDGPVETRREGDTLIVPILEEVLHVEKRLILREEVRITTRRAEIHDPQTVTLRREEAVIDQSGTAGSSS